MEGKLVSGLTLKLKLKSVPGASLSEPKDITAGVTPMPGL